MLWPQQGDTEEPDTNLRAPQQEKQRDITGGTVVSDYDTDVDYEPQGSNPEIKAVNKEEENSDTEQGKMELPQQRTQCQR